MFTIVDPSDFPTQWESSNRETCHRHISDKWLKQAIRAAAKSTIRCSYCHKLGACSIDVLLAAFWRGALHVWEDANGALFFDSESESGFAGDVVDGQDLISDEYAELWLDEELAETVRAASNVDISYCRRDMWRLQRNKYLRRGWEAFVEHVKYRTRFVYWADRDDGFSDPDVMKAGAILEQIVPTLEEIGAVKHCAAGTIIYRAVPSGAGVKSWGATRVGTVPRDLARFNNRFNPYGIPMFYGADNIDTALKEPRAKPHTRFCVGEFEVSKEFHFIDLSAIPTDVTEFHPTLGHLHFDLMFLTRFAREVSMPASSKFPDLDYVPTQVVAEWFMRTNRFQHPVIAIYYRSSIDRKGCWVIDVDNEHCVDSTAPPSLDLELRFRRKSMHWS